MDKKLYICTNDHSYYNMKFCPSCFKKSKYYFCRQCLNLVALYENHTCYNQVKYVIEIEKIPFKFEKNFDENTVQTIQRLFGKCQYYKLDFLNLYIVNCGQRFYNVYYNEYHVKKIEQVFYNKVPFEDWEDKGNIHYLEFDGSNLFDVLEKENHVFIYETLRKVGISSIYEYLASYPLFNGLKTKLNLEYQVGHQFVGYENDLNNFLCKVASIFVKKPRKQSLLSV